MAAPVTLAEAREYVRILEDDTGHDDLLTRHLAEACSIVAGILDVEPGSLNRSSPDDIKSAILQVVDARYFDKPIPTLNLAGFLQRHRRIYSQQEDA